MRVAIFGQTINQESKAYIQLLFDELKTLNASLCIYADFEAELQENIAISVDYEVFDSYQNLDPSLDLMFCIGGDGTILKAATLVRDLNIPILGINTGRLGFLANVAKSDVQKTIAQLQSGAYRIEDRALISIENKSETFGELNFAVNEVTINRKDTTSMISVHVELDDAYLNTYWADGLIVSTPTGSTGYSLSCGGPIIMPGSNNMVITPIAPHNLNVRPLVIDDKHELTIQVSGREDEYLIGLDSRIHTLKLGAEIKLKKADFSLKMLIPEDHDYPSTLRNKLLWGLDKRN
ncbi:MAG: NAD kinase [Flavobacteriales bacterium]